MKHIGYWLIPLLIGLLLWMPTGSIPVSPDGAWYSGLALNLYHDEGFVDLDNSPLYMRPLFPILIAFAYSLWGPEPYSAFIIIRLSFLANIVLTTLLARMFYGRWAGLVAGLLTVTAYTLNEWSTWVNLDPVLPTFLLLYLTLTYYAFQRKSIFWFVCAGLAIGLACLVKETAIFFVPLPFVYAFLLPEFRRQRSIKLGVWWGVIAFIATLMPWFIYVVNMADNPWSFIGHAPQRVVGEFFGQFFGQLQNRPASTHSFSISALLLDAVQRLITIFRQFYHWHLAPNLTIAPVAVAALFLASISALKGHRGSLYLLLAHIRINLWISLA